MRNRGQILIGTLLVVLGVIFLLSTLFDVDIWRFCWPVGLIVVGVWLVLRPRMAAPGSGTEVTLFGDIRHYGDFIVQDQEFWLGIGDIDLDLSDAQIPAGETVWRFYTFIGDVKLVVPQAVGVSVHAVGFVVDSELLGHDMDAFFAPVNAASENYATAEKRLRIELTGFVTELKVRQR